MYLIVFVCQLCFVYSNWYSGEEKQQTTIHLDTEEASKPISTSSPIECILECQKTVKESYYVEKENQCFCLKNEDQKIFSRKKAEGIFYASKRYRNCQEIKDVCLNCKSGIHTVEPERDVSTKVFCDIDTIKGTKYTFLINGKRHPSLKLMDKWEGFPQTYGVGKTYVGDVQDEVFRANEIITWENTAGRSGPYQWLGFSSSVFANKQLHIEFWIKFVASVPNRSNNFGMKVYGVVYNSWVDDCQKDEWCKVSLNIKCRSNGYYVILIFDSINRRQVVRITHFTLTILK
ncbi:uncharacterized protein [Clytia hemisphaerica]|uniref:uncharacterized protein n=1 Tax=Clytia hemisphaerica TaxID=252671 RepID=UPI0034D67C2D